MCYRVLGKTEGGMKEGYDQDTIYAHDLYIYIYKFQIITNVYLKN